MILTPAAERGSGMVRRAEELAKKHGWFLARQFENPANPAYHRQTTGAEILRDFAGKRLDYWVTGWGTGGTLTGVGEVLEVARPEREGRRRANRRARRCSAARNGSRTRSRVGRRTSSRGCSNKKVGDEFVSVDRSRRARHRAASRTEGRHFRRHLGGRARWPVRSKLRSARRRAASMLAMLPDTGERYLSTILFEGIPEGSDDDWLASLG